MAFASQILFMAYFFCFMYHSFLGSVAWNYIFLDIQPILFQQDLLMLLGKYRKKTTIEMVKVVKAYNRDPGGNINKVLSSQIWLKPWLQHVSHSLTFVCPILFLIVGLFLCIWHYIRKEESIFKLRSLLLFMFPSAISALFWFITAP